MTATPYWNAHEHAGRAALGLGADVGALVALRWRELDPMTAAQVRNRAPELAADLELLAALAVAAGMLHRTDSGYTLSP